MSQIGDYLIDTNGELGSGGYGKVVIGKHAATGEKVACKIVSTSRMKLAAIQKEIELMAKLQHPYIIGLKGAEAVGKYQYIFMELATGGELFSRVISSGSLTEDQARPFFKQLLEAVQYMHVNGVVHRDLKLENVLLDGKGDCKVCDFGLAHVYQMVGGKLEVGKLREVCGSKSYCAPEVLVGSGYIGFPTDVWSCGICLFAMLAGFFPLDEASGSDWRYERVKLAANANQSVSHAIYGFYDRQCMLSKEVTDIIDGMLIIQPERRLTVEMVLDSPWVTGAMVKADPSNELVYRGGGGGQHMNMSADELRALFAQESLQPAQPLYRGGGHGGAPSPPPMLCKQRAMSVAEFIAE